MASPSVCEQTGDLTFLPHSWVSGAHPLSVLPRMSQLRLSWLGLGQLAASPWLHLLLAGATWLLARILD